MKLAAIPLAYQNRIRSCHVACKFGTNDLDHHLDPFQFITHKISHSDNLLEKKEEDET